jgi:hypothetical protein
MKPMKELVEELKVAFEDGGDADQPLDEAAKHHPFKRKAKLGPGPRGGRNKKATRYKFGNKSCKKYVCKGTDKKTGSKVTVRIDPSYKREYNREYRQWRAKKKK